MRTTMVSMMKVQAVLTAMSVAVTLSPHPLAAQNDSSRSRDGIVARYTMQLLEKGERNDRYRVVLTADNTNPYDAYYGKPVRKQPDGSMGMNTGDDRSFARVRIYNSSGLEGFLGQTATLSGEDTRLQAEGDVQMFRLAAGSRLQTELTFTVRSGKVPNSMLMLDAGMKRREAFRVISGMTGSSGDWVSDCGGIGMFLAMSKNAAGRSVLEQTVDNRRQTWVQVSEGIYEKPGDNTARVTYNKAGNIYTYSNEDGATCIWRRR